MNVETHHLRPLCGTTKRTRRPFAHRGYAVATNGAMLLAAKRDWLGSRRCDLMDQLDAVDWQFAGSAPVDDLRAFLRRKQERIRRNTWGYVSEPVSIFGVVVDAQRLRPYLPGAMGEALTFQHSPPAKRALGRPDMLRIVGDSWYVCAAGIVIDPAEVFP